MRFCAQRFTAGTLEVLLLHALVAFIIAHLFLINCPSCECFIKLTPSRLQQAQSHNLHTLWHEVLASFHVVSLGYSFAFLWVIKICEWVSHPMWKATKHIRLHLPVTIDGTRIESELATLNSTCNALFFGPTCLI